MSILSNYKIIKELGYGMFANVCLIKNKTDNKKYALKVQHIEKKDLKPSNKSNIWREINFSTNFANKYPYQYIKLWEYDFVNDCETKNKFSFDINSFSLKFQKKINRVNKSPYCMRMVYDLIEGDLHQLDGKLTQKQIYSLIIQLTYSIQLLHSNNYIHGDIHDRNVGWIKIPKNHKIKINNLQVNSCGYLFKLIDYGLAINKSDLVGKKEKKEFKNNFLHELSLLIHFMVDTKIYDFINENKIDVNWEHDYIELKGTRFYHLIAKYSNNESIQMFLFDILFPDQYQKITFGSKYLYTIPRKLHVPLDDILYFILNYKEPNKIIKYFNNKLSE
jgi:serine/threonine protein kinase